MPWMPPPTTTMLRPGLESLLLFSLPDAARIIVEIPMGDGDKNAREALPVTANKRAQPEMAFMLVVSSSWLLFCCSPPPAGRPPPPHADCSAFVRRSRRCIHQSSAFWRRFGGFIATERCDNAYDRGHGHAIDRIFSNIIFSVSNTTRAAQIH